MCLLLTGEQLCAFSLPATKVSERYRDVATTTTFDLPRIDDWDCGLLIGDDSCVQSKWVAAQLPFVHFLGCGLCANSIGSSGIPSRHKADYCSRGRPR